MSASRSEAVTLEHLAALMPDETPETLEALLRAYETGQAIVVLDPAALGGTKILRRST